MTWSQIIVASIFTVIISGQLEKIYSILKKWYLEWRKLNPPVETDITMYD